MFSLKIRRTLDGYWFAVIDTGNERLRRPLRYWWSPRGVIGVDPDWRSCYDRKGRLTAVEIAVGLGLPGEEVV